MRWMMLRAISARPYASEKPDALLPTMGGQTALNLAKVRPGGWRILLATSRVIGYRLTQETRVQIALDDVASNIRTRRAWSTRRSTRHVTGCHGIPESRVQTASDDVASNNNIARHVLGCYHVSIKRRRLYVRWMTRRAISARPQGKALAEGGILDKYGVELIGAKLEAINKAEDRLLFKEAMTKIGLKTPPSGRGLHSFTLELKLSNSRTHS